MEEQMESDDRLRVQVGDLITRGSGDQTEVVLIVLANMPISSTPPVIPVRLVSPVGDDNDGLEMKKNFMSYRRPFDPETYFDYDEDDEDDEEVVYDFRAGNGHVWAVNEPGWVHAGSSWREVFRAQ